MFGATFCSDINCKNFSPNGLEQHAARGMEAWGMGHDGMGHVAWSSGIGEMRFQPQNSSTHNFGFRLAVVMFLYAGNKITINASRGLLFAAEGSGGAGGAGGAGEAA